MNTRATNARIDNAFDLLFVHSRHRKKCEVVEQQLLNKCPKVMIDPKNIK